MTFHFNRKVLKAITIASALGIAAGSASAEDRTGWPDSFSVGTASQGGTYFVYGAGWANLVSETLGIPGGTEVTGGPVQNAALVQAGELDMAMVTMGPAFDAIEGKSALAPGLKHDKIRAIFPMYKTGFHAVALSSSGITSFADIPDGAVVGVGPAGGTPGTYWPRILKGMGKNVEFRNGGAADLAGQLQDGLIDVYTWAGGLPYPAFSQLDAQTDVTYFGFTPDEQKAVVDTQPVSKFTIPKGIYPSLNEDQLSVSMWNFAIAHADLPESFVYKVVDTIMSNNPKMLEIHKAAVETLPENFDKNTFIPWHPGAARWFKENGFDIAPELEG
ncbi:MAG: TAXI family TRAP transporter solute-binding subunit [Pseudomonadota bacterium]